SRAKRILHRRRAVLRLPRTALSCSVRRTSLSGAGSASARLIRPSSSCYSAGQGFTERPHHVHLARNEGRKPAVFFVTYLGLKHGVNPDVPAPSPGNCPF
ncbi:MAG: hypothetical protein ACXVH3_26215, partial [Solirubrobacteraceae bacterium]